MLDAGLNQSEVAARLGVTKAAISLAVKIQGQEMTKHNGQSHVAVGAKNHSRRYDIPGFGERIRALFPQVKSVARYLGAVLGRGHSSIDDILAGRNVPREVEMIVELLEATPRDNWPMRWRNLED